MGLLDQIELAKQLLLHGASEEAAAAKIGIPRSRLNKLLTFEDHASPTLKDAARQGRVSASAAFVLMELDDHVEQDKKLAELLTVAKPTVRAARSLAKPEENASPRRPIPRRLLERVDANARGNEWMQGARAALSWVLDGTLHKDLNRLLDSADAPTPGPKAKKKTT
jgi:hypothetical protein